jgi:hypothetical protein
MFTDIVMTAMEKERDSLQEQKKDLEHIYLTKTMEELDKLNDQLKEVIKKYGIHSLEAQQFMRENMKLTKDIQRRIQAQDKKGAIGKAMEDIAEIENNLKRIEDEICIRKMLNQQSFSRA